MCADSSPKLSLDYFAEISGVFCLLLSISLIDALSPFGCSLNLVFVIPFIVVPLTV
jgi:hypothetical protein